MADVLYLALEDGPRRLQGRLALHLAGRSVPEGLTFATEWPPLDQGGIEALEEWLRDHSRAVLVVIDTLAKVKPKGRPNGNVYAEDYAASGDLAALARKYRVAILVLHHLRKMAAEDWLDAISSTLGLVGGADAVLGLFRHRGQTEAALRITGRDIEERELALDFNPASGKWSVLGDGENLRLRPERAEIVSLLSRADEPMTPSQVATALGKNPSTIKYLLRSMLRDDQLQVLAGGRYINTPNSPNPTNPPSSPNRVSELVGLGVCEDADREG